MRSSIIKPTWPYTLNAGHEQAQFLQAWWPGDPFGSSRLIDLSGRSHHATITKPVWVQGKGGPGIYLNSTTSYCDIPITIGPEFTLAFWVYYDVASYSFPNVDGRIINGGDATRTINIDTVPGAGNEYSFYDGTFLRPTTATAGVPARTLTHVAYSVKNGAQAIYLNGQPNGSSSLSFTPAAGTALMLGSTNGSNGFIGTLRDITLHSKALSARVVQSLYDPATRWALRYQPSRRSYYFPAAAPSNTGNFFFAF